MLAFTASPRHDIEYWPRMNGLGGTYPAPSNTREVMTVGDLNTYGIYFYVNDGTMNLYDTFTGAVLGILTKPSMSVSALVDWMFS